MKIDWSKLRTAEQIAAEQAEQQAASIRQERDRRIAATDYMVLPDYPNAPADLLTYRQALRDITEQATFPASVVWPELN